MVNQSLLIVLAHASLQIYFPLPTNLWHVNQIHGLGACTSVHTNMGHVIVSIVSCTFCLKQNADESIKAIDSDP